MSETLTFKARNNQDVEVDARLWNEAKTRTEGRGDGRLGEDDAKALFKLIVEDATYSELERHTLKHIRSHFQWTTSGDATFRRLVREAASKGWTAEDLLTTSFKAESGRDVKVDGRLWGEAQARTSAHGDGRLGQDDAQALFDLITEDGTYSEIEKKTVKHIRQNFKWTKQGDEHFRTLIRNSAAKGWSKAEIDAALSDAPEAK
jgi:uncharacterized tellurite resistance protein B-like protein